MLLLTRFLANTKREEEAGLALELKSNAFMSEMKLFLGSVISLGSFYPTNKHKLLAFVLLPPPRTFLNNIFF